MTIQNPKSKIKNGLLTLAGLSLLAVGGPVVEKTEEGNRLYQAGQYEQAQTRYVEARSGVEEKTENSNRLHLNLGDALYQQKKYAEARKEFEQAAGSESVDLQAQSAYNIGNTYFKEALQTQDQNQGLELLKQAVGSFRKTLELKPHTRILQSWRTTDFAEEEPDSLLEVLLAKTKGGTRLTLNHSKIPTGHGPEYKKGWIDFYFKPMKEYFSREK